MLFAQHISKQEPAVHVIYIGGWNPSAIQAAGGWQAYLEQVEGWVQGDKTVFIFDDVQATYEDSDLWREFFKEIISPRSICHYLCELWQSNFPP